MSPRKILIIQLKRLGDVLLATPAVSWLRKRFPEAQIDFAVYSEFAGVLENNPHIYRVLSYPRHPLRAYYFLRSLRKERYDWIVDFLANGASAWMSFLTPAQNRAAFQRNYPKFIYNIQIPSPQGVFYSPDVKIKLLEAVFGEGLGGVASTKAKLYVQEAKVSAWRDVLVSAGHLANNKLLFAFAPTSRQQTRRWPAARYAGLARRLVDNFEGSRVVCLWGPGERQYVQEVVTSADHKNVLLSPQFKTIHDLAAFLSHTTCLITNCNGAKHVAVAMNVPTLTVHMSSDPAAWNPPHSPEKFDSRHPVVRAEGLWCIGCRKNVCPFNLECANWVSVDQVFAATSQLLQTIGVV